MSETRFCWSALDLKIQSNPMTRAGSQDGLRLNGPSLIRTPAGAKPLNNAIRIRNR